jgi:molecular chaperone DnaK
VPFEIVAADNGDAWVTVEDKKYAPAQISAMVLEKDEGDRGGLPRGGGARRHRDRARPTSTTRSDRPRRTPAPSPGLNVLRIINEPTAAALAYGLDKKGPPHRGVRPRRRHVRRVHPRARQRRVRREGHERRHVPGGEDFDNRIMEFCSGGSRKRRASISRATRSRCSASRRLRRRRKHELSSIEETDINLPFLTSTPSGPVHPVQSLDRATLEEVVGDLIERLGPPCDACLKDAGLNRKDLDAVLLVGA